MKKKIVKRKSNMHAQNHITLKSFLETQHGIINENGKIVENSTIDAVDRIEEVLRNFEPEEQNNIINNIVNNAASRRYNEFQLAVSDRDRKAAAFDTFIKQNPASEAFIKDVEEKRNKHAN